MDRELPRLTASDGGTQVFYHGKNLYSPTGPRASAERRADLVNAQPQSLILVPSPLLCYGIDRLLERLPETCSLLCVETDETLMALTFDHIPERYRDHPRVQFARTNSAGDLVAYVRKRFPLSRFRRLVVARLNGGYSLNAPAYRMFTEALEREIRVHWRNRLTGAYFGRLWLRNLFTNLGDASRSSAIAPVSGVDRPVVIAGAGESLEEVIPWLVRNRDGIFLLSVDTALPVLEAAGVSPDLVVAVEAQWANLQDFVPIGTRRPAPLWIDLSAAPVVSHSRSVSVVSFFLSRFAPCVLIDQVAERCPTVPIVPPLGSVGLTAVHLARTVWPGPIFLAGLDFSYRRGKPHARGAASHLQYLRTHTRLSGDFLFSASVARRRVGSPALRRHGFVTDAVLLSYAGDLRASLSGDARCYAIGNPGLDAGVPLIEEEAEFRRVIKEGARRKALPPGTPAPPVAGDSGSATPARKEYTAPNSFKALLEEERVRLRGITDIVVTHLNIQDAQRRTEHWTAVNAFLESADYLYFDFPDSVEGPVDTPAFLKRVLANAAGYLRKVEQQLSRSPSS
ncbi:6-hydroxymethylpterin diphosphokinase MptE-like protein [Salinispira pacifica]